MLQRCYEEKQLGLMTHEATENSLGVGLWDHGAVA